MKMSVFGKVGYMRPKSVIERLFIRHLHVSYVKSAESQNAEKSSDEIDVLSELQEPEINEEEILQKRFKSRLPERIYRKFIKKEALPLENKDDFIGMSRIRAYYGRHGSKSNLNPGVCWPTRDEILETIEYDKIFEPPLQERLNNVEAERQAKEQSRNAYEAEVDSNMAKLDKWIADYHARIEKKKADALALKQKREKLVEEISEYLGYDIDPKDPRFQEAVEQREKERKKSLKAKKQQESYEKMIAKLQEMAKK